MTELVLIRHGESEANAGLSNNPDCALTQRGIEQAAGLGRELARHDLSRFMALVSPYRRTVQTAEQIAASAPLQFEIDERIREWGDIASINGREYPRESTDELIARLEDFLRLHHGEKLIIVSHAAPIAMLTNLAWGEDPNVQGQFWASIANCRPRWLRTGLFTAEG